MIIAHGSSEPRTIRAAVRKMREFVASGVNGAIVERLERVARMPEFSHLREAEPEAA
jgi:fatty acid/phospholipid biosynthesis enzyme